MVWTRPTHSRRGWSFRSRQRCFTRRAVTSSSRTRWRCLRTDTRCSVRAVEVGTEQAAHKKPRLLLPARLQKLEIRKVAKGPLRACGRIHDEELHWTFAGVEGRVEPALRHIDGTARPDLAGDRLAVLVLDHLLAGSGDDKDDLLGTWMIVAGMTLAGLDVDDSAREATGAVDFRSDRQGQPPPIESEAIHLASIDEELLHCLIHAASLLDGFPMHASEAAAP